MKKPLIVITFLLLSHFVAGQSYMKLDASFYSPSLGMIRMVDIYLPGEYYIQPDAAFPVIYYLHGGGGNQNSGSYSAMTYYSNHYADSTITSPAAIFVCPDGSCDPYMGSMWLNSELYGNYEDYVIHDVRDFISSNFRVQEDKNFHFIHGHSMGGFGSAYLATKYPDLFRAACPSAGAFSWSDTLVNAWRNYLYEENDGFYLDYSAGQYTQIYFTLCGGFSPDTNAQPWYFQSLYDTLGNVVDTVYEKWLGFCSANMIKDIPPGNNLAYFLICGVEDELSFFPSNEEMVDTLQKYGRDYQTAWHNYGHTVFDPVSHKAMFNWVDSLIMEAYTQVSVSEFNIQHSTFNISCYPNPFSEIVHIEYEIENPSRVSIQVFNAVGEKVADLSVGILAEGKHQIIWNAAHLPAGLYFVRLNAGKENANLKLIKQ
jgi:S-formylglutathione hydrolase FrmB